MATINYSSIFFYYAIDFKSPLKMTGKTLKSVGKWILTFLRMCFFFYTAFWILLCNFRGNICSSCCIIWASNNICETQTTLIFKKSSFSSCSLEIHDQTGHGCILVLWWGCWATSSFLSLSICFLPPWLLSSLFLVSSLFLFDLTPATPSTFIHGILQARTLEWVAIPFSRGSSRPRDWTWVSCIAHRFFTFWAIFTLLFFFSVSFIFISSFFSLVAGMIVTRNSRFRWHFKLLTTEQDWCSLFNYPHDKP